MTGTLYIVSGPIGNMKDITLRALEILQSVDLILSEDTRETFKLLERYAIKASQISYRDQNHTRIFPDILNTLESGKSVALISDSGTPAISDPGFKLTRELRDRNIPVISIPGPSAVIAALSISGLPTDKFVFLGFLPKTQNQRKELLKTYGQLNATLTIYESPFRVTRLLAEIQEVLGNRRVFLAKDLTKMFEDCQQGKVSELLKNPGKIKEKGEYVVLVAKEGY